MNPDELKQITILKAVDGDALTRLAAALEECQLVDGHTLFAEGDPGDSMYFIAQGCIRIEKRPQSSGSAPKILALLEPGDYFGEMALLDQKPRSAAAVCMGPVRLFRLSKAAFDQLQHSSTPAAVSVLFAMIRTSSDRIRWLSTQLIVYDEVGKAIGEARDLQTLLDIILEQLATASGASWGLLLLRAQFSTSLELRARVNLHLTTAQCDAISNGQGFFAPILRQPQDLLVPNFQEDALFQSCDRLGIVTASLLASPITVEGDFLGLIALGGNETGQFDLNTLNLVRGVARQAAQAILNARHREEEQARSRHSRQFVRF